MSKVIQPLYERITGSLDQRELRAAFELLHQYIAETLFFQFQDELVKLEETYKRLLHYYLTGSNDPMRQKIFSELIASGYEITDKIRQKHLTVDSPDLYYSVRRTLAIHPESISKLTDTIRSSYEIQNITQAESLTIQLFKSIWTSVSLQEADMNSLQRSLLNPEPPSENDDPSGYRTILNCQLVSALILGLQTLFDRRKIQLLITAAGSDDEQVKIRAYTGIMITLYRYKNRLEHYPDLKYRIDALSEREEFNKIVYFVILRFILARETENITNRMKEEIVPEMMKLNPKFDPKKHKNEIFFENIDFEMNPEWMEKFERTGLGKKLEEFSQLQEEGADVMLFSFVNLKHFPFFSEISHWFLPFYSGLSLLSDTNIVTKSLDIMTKVGLMCNSDLYSFYFSMKTIHSEGREGMLLQFESQLAEWQQQQNASLQTNNDRTERIIGHYIQDLYRFFKLFPRKKEFSDIFAQNLDFHNLPIVQRYFSDRNDLLNIAEYYLRKNYFEDALTIYIRLSDSFEGDEMLFQKKGYCHQMTGDFTSALNEYAKAEMINPDSKWLFRRTAQCYRAVKKPEKALEYYFLLEKSNPDAQTSTSLKGAKQSISVNLSIGACYMEMKNYAEALKYYFKVDYLDPDSGKAWRPIAWCSFLMGKFEQARNYYHKILSSDPDFQDYTNAGHTEWALRQLQSAFDYYTQSIRAAKDDYETFRAAFINDIPNLRAANIPVGEIPFLLDKLQYQLKTES